MRSLTRSLKSLAGRARDHARALAGRDKHRYLRSCRGIIHVGANLGQERQIYAAYGLRVLWIEPIPQIFDRLTANLAGYPDQRAIKALITDKDGEILTLHVANNDGASSSIFDLHQHKDVWPEVAYVGDLRLPTATLVTALRSASIDWTQYDALVMDTQGSELLVLKGASEILPGIAYIVTEAADFEAYKDATTLIELEGFLAPLGFKLASKRKFAERAGGGAYYDVLFKRTPARS
jgi:2-O-methyltransferase